MLVFVGAGNRPVIKKSLCPHAVSHYSWGEEGSNRQGTVGQWMTHSSWQMMVSGRRKMVQDEGTEWWGCGRESVCHLHYLVKSVSTVSFKIMSCYIKWRLQNNTSLTRTKICFSCDRSSEAGGLELLYQRPEWRIFMVFYLYGLPS